MVFLLYISGLKASQIMYVDPVSNYYYFKTSEYRGSIYLRCGRRTCGGRAILRQHGVINVTRAHADNHDDAQDAAFLCCARFKQRLRERCAAELTPLHTIFIEEQERDREGAY